jgi:hypothetical protein
VVVYIKPVEIEREKPGRQWLENVCKADEVSLEANDELRIWWD